MCKYKINVKFAKILVKEYNGKYSVQKKMYSDELCLSFNVQETRYLDFLDSLFWILAPFWIYFWNALWRTAEWFWACTYIYQEVEWQVLQDNQTLN